MQTLFDFTLPCGYVDGEGNVHRHGQMRLATALDEIEPQRDPRVQQNEAYLPVLLLARVVERLGNLETISPRVMEGLFAADLAYLQDLYLHLNSGEPVVVGALCLTATSKFQLQVAPLTSGAPLAEPA
jgi:hypothetical protein